MANGDYVGRVFKLDAQTGRLLATIRVGGLASGIAGNADGTWVFIANRSQLLRIDPTSNRIVARISVGPGAFNLAASAGRVWVANDNAGTVSEIDSHTNRVLRSAIHIGTRAASIVANGDEVFVSNPDRSQVTCFRASAPDKQTHIHAAGMNLVLGGTRLWILGDQRLTSIRVTS